MSNDMKKLWEDCGKVVEDLWILKNDYDSKRSLKI